MATKKYYSVWQMFPDGEARLIGALFIAAHSNKKIDDVVFQYNPDVISDPLFLPLDPINTPISFDKIIYPSSGRDLPGFIDDCLPDDWGRRIIAHHLKKRFVDTLTILNNISFGASTGAIKIIPSDAERPIWYQGISFNKAKEIADKV